MVLAPRLPPRRPDRGSCRYTIWDLEIPQPCVRVRRENQWVCCCGYRVATPTSLHVCCCVPEGELLGASTALRGKHPKSSRLCTMSPVATVCYKKGRIHIHTHSVSYPPSSCSIVSSGSWCVACHRIAWTPCSFLSWSFATSGTVPGWCTCLCTCMCAVQVVQAPPSRCMIRSGVLGGQSWNRSVG
jgi:hypothetical protein